ncbi:penicillin-binding protein 1B [Balneatrix alpica]|uniref:Penicillin-binding protein 1B n=1 Tax=Balneatrix alpica TaxID=75684 RepID=A0ABV5ZBJ4_9GAMM|nr:penicillin-binding protein 1B [Balneatrix alpica]
MARKRKATGRRSSGFALGGLLLKLTVVGMVVLAGVMAYLDAQIVSRFEGHRWAIPAKVYARPLELYEGVGLNEARLQNELAALGYRLVNRVEGPGQVEQRGPGRYRIYNRGFLFADGAEPEQLLEVELQRGRVQALRDAQGQTLAIARLEPQLIGGFYPTQNEDRELVTLDEVPPLLVETLITIEDRAFYDHFGISPKGIARAMWANLRAGRVVQGGSTLTQQLVKNYYLEDNSRNLVRKLLEAPMAVLLELHYSKREILEAYLNEVYLGQDGARAIHGFGQASLFYFGQPLKELNPAQVSLLVGMVKGPSLYNPRRHPERATERRNLVLQVLGEQGIMPVEYAQGWAKQPLAVTDVPLRSRGGYPAFMALVRQQLQQFYDPNTLSSAGLRVFTTLDPFVQQAAEQSLEQVSARLLKKYAQRLDNLEGALISANPHTGEVLAVVGSRNPRFHGFNRALEARRNIGSLVKPAVYLTALEQYQQYSLATLVDDSPLSIKAGDGSQWSPKNFDKESHGRVPLWQALALSYNQSTARLGLELGLPRVKQTMERLGVTASIEAVPSMLLGATSLTPLEVTQMYQTLAAGGFQVPLRAVTAVLDEQGQPLQAQSLHFQPKQVVDPRFVALLHYAMQQTVEVGTARSIRNHIPAEVFVAGKTGTSNDQRDSWFAGFTEDYLTVAWLGRDDSGPTPLTGGGGALQVWIEMMKTLAPAPWQRQYPAGISQVWTNAQGLQTDPGCAGARLLPYIAGAEPQRYQSCQSRPTHTPSGGSSGSDSGVPRWLRNLFGG